MTIEKETLITKDEANRKLLVVREFEASVADVWRAWTESELLDLWWAPKPWKAETKTMDFREGGKWLYAMVRPDGTKTYCQVDFHTIDTNSSFVADDYFCNEQGERDNTLPLIHWKVIFNSTGLGTRVETELTFDNSQDLEKIVEMGFEEGYTSALGNLEQLLEKKPS